METLFSAERLQYVAVVRLGIMIGPERGRYATKVERMLTDAVWAEDNGFATIWVPQIPDEFDAMTAVAAMGMRTSRIEIGTAVVPIQTRHPIALVQQALSTHMVCGGRFTLGLGPSHHWVVTDMLGLSYDRPAAQVASLLDVLDAAFSGPATVDVDNDHHHIHNPIDITDQPGPSVLVSALGPVMLKLAGERTDGTSLWLADERAIGDYIAPRLVAAAEGSGRKAPRIVAGVPVCLCGNDEIDRAKDRANRVLSEASISPNYQRLLDRGNADNVGDILAAGDEQSVLQRLRSFADAGVTDMSIRVVPIGDNRDELLASMRRTRDYLADLAPEI